MKYMIFLLLSLQMAHAMYKNPLPTINERATPPSIIRNVISRPLRYAQQIVVLTSFKRGQEFSIITTVVDEHQPHPRDPLFKIETHRKEEILVAHETGEDWCLMRWPGLR